MNAASMLLANTGNRHYLRTSSPALILKSAFIKVLVDKFIFIEAACITIMTRPRINFRGKNLIKNLPLAIPRGFSAFFKSTSISQADKIEELKRDINYLEQYKLQT
ncbi:hypothetical protein RND81_03G020100 [Saponaria officinalis]|uniref:Uncharacterized protein n=1 Tax=Saponaria officinalis TaxID=3572 RepID=A0AAW1M4P5_SAPOF